MDKIYDISLPLSADLPVWPGDATLKLERANQLEKGDIANVTRLEGGVHIGTHIDAPYHFLGDGITIDQIPLDCLIGDAQVIDVSETVGLVTSEVLACAKLEPPFGKLLIKTRNSRFWEEGIETFQENYVGLSQDGAEYLVEKGYHLVGIDYLSIAPYSSQTPTHITLLRAKVVILEAVNLSKINPGRYELICLPLNIQGSDGAFARAVLRANV